MDETSQDFESPLNLEEEPRPPYRAIVLTTIFIFLSVIGIFTWYALNLNTEPKAECSYRGGVWSKEGDECIFENGVGAGSQQVGMIMSRIELVPPGLSVDSISFSEVEIGGSQTFTEELDDLHIQISLLPRLGKVQKETQDLVMPVTVSVRGGGESTYLGIFAKEEGVYRLKDSLAIGDRIAVEGVLLLQKQKEGSFLGRVLYRGRREGQAFSAVPTEPKTVEVVIDKSTIVTSWVKTRDGVVFEDMVRVEQPAFLSAVSASPLKVSGYARGTWFFKGEFPVSLVLEEDGTILGQGVARASDEWETEEYVPFTATLAFKGLRPTNTQEVFLVLSQGTPRLGREAATFKMPLLLK